LARNTTLTPAGEAARRLVAAVLMTIAGVIAFFLLGPLWGAVAVCFAAFSYAADRKRSRG
jgi:hypothetical protein